MFEVPLAYFSLCFSLFFCPKFTFLLLFQMQDLTCWNQNSAQSRRYYKFVIWGTIHLLLHNFDPGYHNKIML